MERKNKGDSIGKKCSSKICYDSRTSSGIKIETASPFCHHCGRVKIYHDLWRLKCHLRFWHKDQGFKSQEFLKGFLE